FAGATLPVPAANAGVLSRHHGRSGVLPRAEGARDGVGVQGFWACLRPCRPPSPHRHAGGRSGNLRRGGVLPVCLVIIAGGCPVVNDTRPSRADYYAVLADTLPAEALVVTSLGNASYLWAAMHHAPRNFYIEDAMGLALPLALGLAVAQPMRPVIVVEGDGAVLMHLGAVVTGGAVALDKIRVGMIQKGSHSGCEGMARPNVRIYR